MVAQLPDLRALEDQHGSGAYAKRPLSIVRGMGCTVWDDAGNAYLDATSGMGVALLGHAHPAIVAAISAQAAQVITVPEAFYTPLRAQLYATLREILPGEIGRFFLCNSGAEAIEAAMKVARLLTGREGLVATRRAFHGRTLGALALTANPKYRVALRRLAAIGAAHQRINDLAGRARLRLTVRHGRCCLRRAAARARAACTKASVEFLRGLRERCDRDGRAAGSWMRSRAASGRTGYWLACEAAGVVPDIVCLGKGLGGGLPIGLVAWRSSLGSIPRGSHGSTFGGNPLVCAAALATLHTLRDEGILLAARERGAWLREQLEARRGDWPLVRALRGRGLLIGLELRGRVTPVLRALQEQGVLALPAGQTVLRLLPPLILQPEEAERLIAALDAVLR